MSITTSIHTNQESGSRAEADHTVGGLELRSIHKSYGGGSNAVEELDLHIAPGEFVTFLGPSGSGKTSTLRMIAGFEAPTAGDIEMDGRSITRLSPAARGFGMVFQDYALFPHMTVAQNVAYGLRIRRIRASERRRIVNEMLELVHLEGLGERFPAQLSGGQQQRVSMARAIAFGPRLLLMDEPLGALDRQLRLQMEAELRRIHRELGTTILYVTHDQDEALALSDRIAIMRDGRLVEYATARSIFETPRTVFAAEFVARCNVLDGLLEVAGGQATLVVRGQRIPLETYETWWAPGDVKVGIRRDAFRLGDGDELVLDAHVEGALYRGEFVDATCVLSDGCKVDVRFPSSDAPLVVPGTSTRLTVAASDLRLLVDEA